MKLELRRVAQGENGTFGMLLTEDVPLCLTLEKDWVDNTPNLSCIPPGTYNCIRHDSPKYTHVWEVLNVPGRTGILFHNGNLATGPNDNTDGCILVGNGLGSIGGIPAILNSITTLDMLRGKLPDKFMLEIIDC